VAVIVVGGNSRSVGKTSVVAGLIARLPEFHWTAFKITQYGHGFCTADGKPCQCQTADSCVAVNAEHDRASGTDTSRFLAAGASRSIWVRTRIGMLAEAMPKIEKEIQASQNAILESNSILEFFKPDLYLTVLDPGVADFKDSARRFLGKADALLISSPESADQPTDPAVHDKPRFQIPPPDYMSEELVAFVRARLTAPNPDCQNGVFPKPAEGNYS
jgi:molybdopterin-guanine dinucleotide biosynthesis protein